MCPIQAIKLNADEKFPIACFKHLLPVLYFPSSTMIHRIYWMEYLSLCVRLNVFNLEVLLFSGE